MSEKRQRVTFWVEPSTLRQLEAIKDETGASKSAQLRRALRAWIDLCRGGSTVHVIPRGAIDTAKFCEFLERRDTSRSETFWEFVDRTAKEVRSAS